jgi:hypothetical protein
MPSYDLFYIIIKHFQPFKHREGERAGGEQAIILPHPSPSGRSVMMRRSRIERSWIGPWVLSWPAGCLAPGRTRFLGIDSSGLGERTRSAPPGPESTINFGVTVKWAVGPEAKSSEILTVEQAVRSGAIPGLGLAPYEPWGPGRTNCQHRRLPQSESRAVRVRLGVWENRGLRLRALVQSPAIRDRRPRRPT